MGEAFRALTLGSLLAATAAAAHSSSTNERTIA